MKSMKMLLAIAALATISQSAFAGQSVKISIILDAQNVYTQISDTAFAGNTSTGHLELSVSGVINGTPVSQSQNQDLGTNSFGGAGLTLLPNSQVKFTGTNGSSITVPASFEQNGNFVVQASDVESAIKVLVKAQLADFSNKIATMGAKGKVVLKGKKMNCEKGEQRYTCSQGFSLFASMSK